MAITNIASNGWVATYSGAPPSTLLNETLTLTSPGYDGTGAAASDVRGILVTRRLRVAGSTDLDAAAVGLSMVAVAGATAPGVTNASTQTSPLPIAAWVTRFRDVIDGSARTVEIAAGHYYGRHDGRQVACVIVTASDGVTTVSQTVTNATVSGIVSAAGAVYAYAATFTAAQMGSLAEGLITYNARVIPWIGDNAAATDVLRSIANTEDWSARGLNQTHGFSPRYDVKDLTRIAVPPLAYIDPVAGNNTTGRWSTDAATARSLPFLNVAGAENRNALDIPAGSSALLIAGSMDGGRIRLMAGTSEFNTASASIKTVKCAAVIIERDPLVAKAAAILNVAGGRLRLGGYAAALPGSALRLRDLTATRLTTGQVLFDYGTCIVQVEGVDWNNNGIAGALVSSTTSHVMSMLPGTVITGITSATPNVLRAPKLFRGVTINGAASMNLDATNLFGCRVTDVSRLYIPSHSALMGNHVTVLSLPVGPVQSLSDAAFATQIFKAGNVWEAATASGDYPMSRLSGDSEVVSTSHIVEVHETYAGVGGIGRHNHLYVDVSTPTTSRDRTHIWTLLKNSILVSYNTKHDRFTPSDALRIGGWQVAFGVGHDGNLIQYVDAGAGGFAPDYEGPNGLVGTSVSAVNPLFVAPAAAQTGGVSGAGGGNYRLQSGSPALNLTAGPLLPGFSRAAGAAAPSEPGLTPNNGIIAVKGTATTVTFTGAGSEVTPNAGNISVAGSATVVSFQPPPTIAASPGRITVNGSSPAVTSSATGFTGVRRWVASGVARSYAATASTDPYASQD